jgi:hypothetical protein
LKILIISDGIFIFKFKVAHGVNLSNLKQTIKAYKKRMGIEAMFKNCPKGLASRRKSGGYNLEQCHSNNKRLLSLNFTDSDRLHLCHQKRSINYFKRSPRIYLPLKRKPLENRKDIVISG